MKTLKFEIPNMQSAHCQMRVKNAVDQVEGATIVSIQPGVVHISTDGQNHEQSVASSIEKAGYPVQSISEIKEEEDTSKALVFMTNLECSGCVASVTKALKSVGVDKIEVDLDSDEKTLAIESRAVNAGEIISIVRKAGFEIESIN